MSDEVMIDTLLLCLTSGGRRVGRRRSCNLFPHLKKHLLTAEHCRHKEGEKLRPHPVILTYYLVKF